MSRIVTIIKKAKSWVFLGASNWIKISVVSVVSVCSVISKSIWESKIQISQQLILYFKPEMGLKKLIIPDWWSIKSSWVAVYCHVVWTGGLGKCRRFIWLEARIGGGLYPVNYTVTIELLYCIWLQLNKNSGLFLSSFSDGFQVQMGFKFLELYFINFNCPRSVWTFCLSFNSKHSTSLCNFSIEMFCSSICNPMLKRAKFVQPVVIYWIYSTLGFFLDLVQW